jgi:hypothetical protein
MAASILPPVVCIAALFMSPRNTMALLPSCSRFTFMDVNMVLFYRGQERRNDSEIWNVIVGRLYTA